MAGVDLDTCSKWIGVLLLIDWRVSRVNSLNERTIVYWISIYLDHIFMVVVGGIIHFPLNMHV